MRLRAHLHTRHARGKSKDERWKMTRRCGARAESSLLELCRAARRKHHPCGGVKMKEERFFFALFYSHLAIMRFFSLEDYLRHLRCRVMTCYFQSLLLFFVNYNTLTASDVWCRKWSKVDNWLSGRKGAKTISTARSVVAQLRNCEDDRLARQRLLNEINRILPSAKDVRRCGGIRL